MIRIVDYGMGNIQAFLTIYKSLGYEAKRARTFSDLEDATKLILPGVGSFDHAMQKLSNSGMRNMLETMALKQKVPLLGVCVGMQMLAQGSDEGIFPGLGWIEGHVRELKNINHESTPLPLPHMGWNELHLNQDAKLLKGFKLNPRFYFLHSYYFDCFNESEIEATTIYGQQFPCVVSHENIFGVQCHPEKSHHFGAQLLKNFADL